MSGELRVEDVAEVLAGDAQHVHHHDPRVRRLASARWRLATGGSHSQWLRLREVDPEKIVRDVQDALRRGQVEPEVRQSEPVPNTPRCVLCTHPKGDHDGHAEHRAKYSPLVAGDPYCHACNGECDYAGPDEFTGIKRGCFFGDRATHMVRRVGIQNKQTACGRWVSDKASKWLPRGTKITCPDCVKAVGE